MLQQKKFSVLGRSETIKEMSSKEFDLLVIGGGIIGSGILLDAASRGMKTALIEMQDFGESTSSRYTKSIHNRLKYSEIGFVREARKEREILHKNAAHITVPEKIILPISKNGNISEFKTSMSLYIHDLLSGVKREEQRKILSGEETRKKIPLIDNKTLKSGILYHEYKTDSARLTIETIKKAYEYGASITNYVKASSFVYEQDGRIKGVNVTNIKNNEKFTIYAKNIVNATGTWLDKLREKDNSLEGKKIHKTKIVNIVIEKNIFPLNHTIYFYTNDKRIVFAIQRYDIVYIGTNTNSNSDSEFDNILITKQEVQYLLDAVNTITNDSNIKLEHVVSAWVELQPLVVLENENKPSKMFIKDEIFCSNSGLISVVGGKLTGHRITAKNIIKIIAKRLKKTENKEFEKCQTKNIRLSGGEFPFYPETYKMIEYADRKYDEVKQTRISVLNFKKLFYRYGMNIDFIIDKAYQYYNETKQPDYAWLKAEVRYSIDHEYTSSISDFFIRRTGMIFFCIKDIYKTIDVVCNIMSKFLDWSETEKQKNLNEINKKLKQATILK